ncbi:MAG TPA: hypothetical protein VHJ58_12710, partial [Vicinamibacterales bacterium]|nr:hypothetical protein [Vicinamibacterales bacterium]
QHCSAVHKATVVTIMAMQAPTVRGIEALKPEAKRYKVFDALTAGPGMDTSPGCSCAVTHSA